MTIAYRPYAPADLPALRAVHDACRETDRIDPHSVCYRLPNLSRERYAEHITLPEATRVAEVGGQVIAHGFMEVWGFEDRCYLWQVWVDPAFRGQGIGTTLLEWGEQKAQELHRGNQHSALHLANATEHERDAVALLQEHGYQLNFVSVELAFDAAMTIPVAPDIAGISFGPLERTHTGAISYALSEANLTEFHGAELQARIADQEHEWLGRIRDSAVELSIVAYEEATQAVVGAYLCNRRERVGEIAQVAVRAPWRNRGIARSLALRSLQQLKAAGCDTVRLFTSIGPNETDPADGPYAMYRKFGFYPIARHLRFRKPMATKPASVLDSSTNGILTAGM